MPNIRSWKENKVLSVSNRKSPMTAIAVTDATRSALGLLVDREERRVGSRDVAFENVARLIGTSSSWVKKFIGRSREVKEPRLTLFFNIRFAYENLCTRVEQEHQAELAKITLLKRGIDAVTGGFVELVQDNSRAPASSKKARRP
jgi:hypothetical protein